MTGNSCLRCHERLSRNSRSCEFPSTLAWVTNKLHHVAASVDDEFQYCSLTERCSKGGRLSLHCDCDVILVVCAVRTGQCSPCFHYIWHAPACFCFSQTLQNAVWCMLKTTKGCPPAAQPVIEAFKKYINGVLFIYLFRIPRIALQRNYCEGGIQIHLRKSTNVQRVHKVQKAQGRTWDNNISCF